MDCCLLSNDGTHDALTFDLNLDVLLQTPHSNRSCAISNPSSDGSTTNDSTITSETKWDYFDLSMTKQKLAYAPSKDIAQPEHLYSLIRAIVSRVKKARVASNP